MASSLPTPVFAALGIVPAVLSGVRSLPGRAVRLPVVAISNALSTVDAVRKEYEDLADRGERLVARLRGEALDRADSLEDRVEDLASRTPFAGAYEKAEDAVEALPPPAAFAAAPEQALAAVAPLADRAARAAARTLGQTADTLADAVDTVAETVETAPDTATDAFSTVVARAADTVPDPAERAPEIAVAPPAGLDEPEAEQESPAETPKGIPTQQAVEPDSTRVDTAASPAVVDAVELAVAGRALEVVDHDELPLPDYDHMTLGSLRGRLRALSVDQLAQIRTYEKAHADRLPVVTMLDNRIAKLATDAGAAPSGPVSTSPAPEQLAAAAGPAGAISPATTDAPPIHAPSQGNPTNAAQPRS